MSTPPNALGFIGLGIMGSPMLENLVKKQSTTKFFIYDVSDEAVEKARQFSPDQIVTCVHSREVADNSDVIISMVPEGSHVKAVYLTPTTGVLSSSLLASKLLIDCSTIDTATSLLIRSRTLSLHPTTSFFDAPVSGGALGAQKASLTFMVGCSSTSPFWPTLQSLLSNMGTSIFACGGPGLGLTAKLCNNYCSSLIAIAVSEAMILGMKHGMSPRVLQQVFSASTAQSAICDAWCPVPGIVAEAPSSKGYEGGFRVELMRKDVGLAVAMAREKGVRLRMGDLDEEVYEGCVRDERCKGKDSRVVYRYLGGVEDWEEEDGKLKVEKEEGES